MEGILMIPKLLMNHEDEDLTIKDFLLYVIVFGLHKIGIFLPRKLFTFFVVYVLTCEILNNLTYKIIPQNKLLAKNCVIYQNYKILEIIEEYLK